MITNTLKTHLGHFYREVDRDVNALLKDGHPQLWWASNTKWLCFIV